MWQPIETAPRNASEIKLKSGERELVGHFAQNLSGEEQPSFSGFFEAVQDAAGKTLYFSEIHPAPTHWRPL